MVDLMKRREFLRQAGVVAGVGATLLATGCGAGGQENAAAPAPQGSTGDMPPEPKLTADQRALNGVLMLGYVGAQYHALAATGAGLAEGHVSGIGQVGTVVGGRGVAFQSETVAAFARELAYGKAREVAILRLALGSAAAGQPAIDFGSGAFGLAARGAGIAPPGTGFDPFTDDDSYLLGAMFLEREVAASYRYLATTILDPALAEALYAVLPAAIYHDALLHSVIAASAVQSPDLLVQAGAVGRYMAIVEGGRGATHSDTDVGLDAHDQPMPVLRTGQQALGALALGQGRAGGFLPAGANGIAA